LLRVPAEQAKDAAGPGSDDDAWPADLRFLLPGGRRLAVVDETGARLSPPLLNPAQYSGVQAFLAVGPDSDDGAAPVLEAGILLLETRRDRMALLLGGLESPLAL